MKYVLCILKLFLFKCLLGFDNTFKEHINNMFKSYSIFRSKAIRPVTSHTRQHEQGHVNKNVCWWVSAILSSHLTSLISGWIKRCLITDTISLTLNKHVTSLLIFVECTSWSSEYVLNLSAVLLGRWRLYTRPWRLQHNVLGGVVCHKDVFSGFRRLLKIGFPNKYISVVAICWR